MATTYKRERERDKSERKSLCALEVVGKGGGGTSEEKGVEVYC